MLTTFPPWDIGTVCPILLSSWYQKWEYQPGAGPSPIANPDTSRGSHVPCLETPARPGCCKQQVAQANTPTTLPLFGQKKCFTPQMRVKSAFRGLLLPNWPNFEEKAAGFAFRLSVVAGPAASKKHFTQMGFPSPLVRLERFGACSLISSEPRRGRRPPALR